MSTPTCHHILANGALCRATPLRNRDYCRFHLQQIGRRMKAARLRARQQRPVLKFPLLEDLYAVQIAFMQLADAIAYNEIEPQRARQLTTVLRLAMQNLKSGKAWESTQRFQSVAAEQTPTAWDSFEQEHDLPADLDLSLDPDVAFPAPPQKTAPTQPPANAGFELDAVPPFDELEWGDHMKELLREAANAPHPKITADEVEMYDIMTREGQPGLDKSWRNGSGTASGANVPPGACTTSRWPATTASSSPPNSLPKTGVRPRPPRRARSPPPPGSRL